MNVFFPTVLLFTNNKQSVMPPCIKHVVGPGGLNASEMYAMYAVCLGVHPVRTQQKLVFPPCFGYTRDNLKHLKQRIVVFTYCSV